MKNLRYWRVRKNLSQKEVAITLGVAAPQISKWESEATEPSLDNLIKLSELYGITLDEIVGRTLPPGRLTSEERELLHLFDQLNAEGQEQAVRLVRTLLESGSLRKETSTQNVV